MSQSTDVAGRVSPGELVVGLVYESVDHAIQFRIKQLAGSVAMVERLTDHTHVMLPSVDICSQYYRLVK